MGYYIDLSLVSTGEYREKLASSFLLPSRMLLKEKLDEHFTFFKQAGIQNVKELQQFLKKKGNIDETVKEYGLSEEYLIVLLREINSLHPKPNKLREFTGIHPETVSRLEGHGIKDTVTLFEKIKTPAERKKLAAETGISHEEIVELAKLTDLSRIRWVGTMFARVLYETGFDTAEKVARADYHDLYNRITSLNRERNLYKGKIGLNDMKCCVLAAGDVTPQIEF